MRRSINGKRLICRASKLGLARTISSVEIPI